jgi:hypothetical protein
MGFVLALALGAFLYLAGDQVASALWPGLPPALGRWILLGGFVLIVALLFAPSRFLAQLVVTGAITETLAVIRVAAGGILAMLRVIWTSGREAFTRLSGGIR